MNKSQTYDVDEKISHRRIHTVSLKHAKQKNYCRSKNTLENDISGERGR